MWNRPPSASTRSRAPRSPPCPPTRAPPQPSSHTSMWTSASARRTRTTSRVAPACLTALVMGIAGQKPDGTFSNGPEIFQYVSCADWPTRSTFADLQADTAEAARMSPRIGAFAASFALTNTTACPGTTGRSARTFANIASYPDPARSPGTSASATTK
jgi:hypothetical protein